MKNHFYFIFFFLVLFLSSCLETGGGRRPPRKQCSTDLDCSSGEICTSNYFCEECEFDDHCEGDKVCSNYGCVEPGASVRCSSDRDCRNTSTPKCEIRDGICVECLGNLDCTNPGKPQCNRDRQCVKIPVNILGYTCTATGNHQCKYSSTSEYTYNCKCGFSWDSGAYKKWVIRNNQACSRASGNGIKSNKHWCESGSYCINQSGFECINKECIEIDKYYCSENQECNDFKCMQPGSDIFIIGVSCDFSNYPGSAYQCRYSDDDSFLTICSCSSSYSTNWVWVINEDANCKRESGGGRTPTNRYWCKNGKYCHGESDDLKCRQSQCNINSHCDFDTNKTKCKSTDKLCVRCTDNDHCTTSPNIYCNLNTNVCQANSSQPTIHPNDTCTEENLGNIVDCYYNDDQTLYKCECFEESNYKWLHPCDYNCKSNYQYCESFSTCGSNNKCNPPQGEQCPR
jgi:hypothetical protein